jgi:DNA invertase Pin-like site-specific DNA recombinase
MPRVLGACRESGRDEESISTENQEKRIRDWAALNGHTVVHITRDKATSGGTPARDREDLGPWLREPDKLDQWDILAVSKLDRGFRSVLDFAATQEWAAKRNKSVASVSEGYDFTTAEGELMANQLVAFAQFERKRAGKRRGEAAEFIRDAGRWNGGRVPYGYKPAGGKGNWRLEPDETTAPVVHRMIREYLGGKSRIGIAAGLNADGIPSALGRTWRDTAVSRVLNSPALMGHTVQMRGRVITTRRGPDGQPIMFADVPLIDRATFDEIQRCKATHSRSRGEPQARHMLWDVGFCYECGGKLYGHRHKKQVSYSDYYACRMCSRITDRIDVIEPYVEAGLLSAAGDFPYREPTLVPGDDHAGEISKLEQRAERYRTDLADEYDEGIAEALQRLEGRIDKLRTSRTPDRILRLPKANGETIAQHWAGLSTATERNKFLRELEVKVWLGKEGRKRLQVGLAVMDTDVITQPFSA